MMPRSLLLVIATLIGACSQMKVSDESKRTIIENSLGAVREYRFDDISWGFKPSEMEFEDNVLRMKLDTCSAPPMVGDQLSEECKVEPPPGMYYRIRLSKIKRRSLRILKPTQDPPYEDYAFSLYAKARDHQRNTARGFAVKVECKRKNTCFDVEAFVYFGPPYSMVVPCYSERACGAVLAALKDPN